MDRKKISRSETTATSGKKVVDKIKEQIENPDDVSWNSWTNWQSGPNGGQKDK